MKKGFKIALLALFLCLVVGLLLELNILFRSDQEDTGAGDIVPVGKGSGSDNVQDTEPDDYYDDMYWTDLY